MDYIRSYMIQRARVLAVVGLHINSFKPHTGTKTSVIFLQKWSNDDFDENGKLKVEDYPIFFASQKQSFKNNSGDYIIEKDRDGLSPWQFLKLTLAKRENLIVLTQSTLSLII
jgi:type I restriction enzyme M protein